MSVRRALRLARLLTPGLFGASGHLALPSYTAAATSLAGGPLEASSWGGSSNSSSGSGSSSASGGSASLLTLMCSSSSSSWSSGCLRLRNYSSAAAAAAEPALAPSSQPPVRELPLWRFLAQQGFSADSISRMHRAAPIRRNREGEWCSNVNKTAMTEAKVQRDVAPNIAALRSEGLDTAGIERLFEQLPNLLTPTQATFSSSLAALRQLAALLPDEPRAVQAPPGATQLGVALWLYPTAAAFLLMRTNLGSLIDSNLRLRRRLGINDQDTAIGLFKQYSTLVTNFERAEAMVAHLQGLQASGALSAEQVAELALSSALSLTPAEFDRRWREGGPSALKLISCNDPAGRQRQQAAVTALGELLQAADGLPGPLQQGYRQQGKELVQRSLSVWTCSPATLRASCARLQQLGLSDSQLLQVIHKQPAVLAYNWDGEAKPRLLAWVQQELGLSPVDFLTRHAGYVTNSVATIAMRADFLRQHRPALWQDVTSRGPGPLLSLLTKAEFFFARSGCTQAELAAFNRAWLATPAGRRWGAKPRRAPRRHVS